MANGKIKPVRTEQDYENALARIDALMDAEPGSPEFDELDVLVDLVELYESKHEPMGYPSPLAAIEFRMEQGNLRPRDLIPFIGSRAKVSEVLSGKRAITMSMARALHQHLGIPADVLLREPDVDLDDPLADLNWRRFPVKHMAKLGWIRDGPNLVKRAETIICRLIDRAGGPDMSPVPPSTGRTTICGQTPRWTPTRSKPGAGRCWQRAIRILPQTEYVSGTVTPQFLREVAQLSWFEDGPRLAREVLEKHGIALVIVPHLPRTYLDGAALRLKDGQPVVGLTLRYDRIDNFWFCLLHELAHVGRHLDNNQGSAFIDDQTLRGVEGRREDPREAQADEWATEALVPQADWEASAAREHPTPMAVMNLAHALQVHPAIIAGKIRHEHSELPAAVAVCGHRRGSTADGQHDVR